MALWPDSHVGPTSLHVLVSQVRAALGDDPNEPRWIRTIPRYGYAFSGTAEEDNSEAGSQTERAARVGLRHRPRLVWDQGSVILAPGENLLGREKGMAVHLDAPGVSRRHARIVVEDGGRAIIEDLGSKNGTFVGEGRVQSSRDLADGDVIRLGRHFRLVFKRQSDPSTVTEGP
jgi:hypothetical protein